MIHKTRTWGVGAILALIAGLWGLSGCLESGNEDDIGNGSVSVTGTWVGTSANQVTLSGGCGPGGGGDAITITAVLTQSGSTVTGTASADDGSFVIQNGAVGDTAFTFNVAGSDANCSQGSNQFVCAIDELNEDAMLCLHTETHCDSCSGAYVTHTVQETFDFSRQ